MNNPLISISIPTRNSGKTLEICLKSLRAQTYKNIEINIVDKDSKDSTLKIAKKYKVDNIVSEKGSLLKARYEGVKISKGDYILIFDSDQVLEKDALKRAVELIKNEHYDMLIFEEFVYKKNTFVEKLFYCDRALINAVNDTSPLTGVVMPRFFKKSLLKKTYSNIPKKFFINTGGPDHDIVYYEASKISKKLGVLKNAVKHIEPSTIKELLPKFFRWGYTSIGIRFGRYDSLMTKRERFRSGLFTPGLIVESLGSITLLLLKGTAFYTGYYTAKIDKMLGLASRF